MLQRVVPIPAAVDVMAVALYQPTAHFCLGIPNPIYVPQIGAPFTPQVLHDGAWNQCLQVCAATLTLPSQACQAA